MLNPVVTRKTVQQLLKAYHPTMRLLPSNRPRRYFLVQEVQVLADGSVQNATVTATLFASTDDTKFRLHGIQASHEEAEPFSKVFRDRLVEKIRKPA